ncbi:MAG TPA: hypothetical protein VNX68_17130 [Nitrosopumilaceae archaeon]|jgi:hypothetical protein|nr:hypothetical protein [Nitrosopumilaceae archaeon]
MNLTKTLCTVTFAVAIITTGGCGSGNKEIPNNQPANEGKDQAPKDVAVKMFTNELGGFTIMLPESAKDVSPQATGTGKDFFYNFKLDNIDISIVISHIDKMLIGSNGIDDAAKNINPNLTIKDQKTIGSDYLVVTNPDTEHMQEVHYFAKGTDDYLHFWCSVPITYEAMGIKIASSLKATK